MIGRPRTCECGACYPCRMREYKRQKRMGMKPTVSLARSRPDREHSVQFLEAEISVEFDPHDTFEDISMQTVESYWRRVATIEPQTRSSSAIKDFS